MDDDQLAASISVLWGEVRKNPPINPAHRLALRVRAETLLAENPSAHPRLRVGLRLTIVEALSGLGDQIDDDTLRCLVAHLAAIRDDSEVLGSPDFVSLMRHDRAVVLMQHRERLDEQGVALAIATFEDVLNHPDPGESHANLGTYAYNAAQLACGDRGPARTDDRHLEDLWLAARHHYQAAGLARRAADAAACVAELALKRLEGADLPADERAGVFDNAWRMVTEARAAISLADEPLAWAAYSELTGSLLLHKPGIDQSARDQIIYYRDLALNVYLQIKDQARAAGTALQIVEEVSHFGASCWGGGRLRRFLYYVDIAAGVPLNSVAAESARCILLANSCERVMALDVYASSEVSERVRTLAEKARTLVPGDDFLCVQALLLIGKSWLDASAPIETGLAQASAAFEQAAARACAAGQPDEETKALRLLGAALARRLIERGETALYPSVVKTLQEAAARSVGEERAVAYVNVLSVIVEGLRKGCDVSVEDAHAALESARMFAHGLNAAHRDYLESLARNVDDLAFGISEAMRSLASLFDDQRRLVSGFVRPRQLHFKWYGRESTKGAPVGSHWTRTMLLHLEDDGRCDGLLPLSYADATVTGTLDWPCTGCDAPLTARLNLVLPFEDDPAGHGRLERELRCLHRCPRCDRLLEVQHAALGRTDGRADLIFPDAFSSSRDFIVMHQGMLFLAICQSWTGQPHEDGYWVSWDNLRSIPAPDSPESHIDARRRELLYLLGGMRFGDEAALEEILCAKGRLRELGSVTADEVDAVMQVLGPADDVPSSVGELTDVANEILSCAREDGGASVVDAIRQFWRTRYGAESAYAAAIEIAADPQRRRAFLERFLAESADYSADREAELYRQLQLANEMQLRAMEEQGGAQKDSNDYRDTLAWVESHRAIFKEFIDGDRKRNSSGPAKTLLRETLGGARRFVLLLRAFRFDIKSEVMSEATKFDKFKPKNVDPRVNWQVNKLDLQAKSNLDRVAAALGEHIGVIMVANVADPMPASVPDKLFVTHIEWRNLAFALIAEAAAIVMLLTAEELSEGVLDELNAILALGRVPQTVVVLKERSDADDFHLSVIASPRGALKPEEVVAKLAQMGFPTVFAQKDFLDSPWEVVRKLSGVDSVGHGAGAA